MAERSARGHERPGLRLEDALPVLEQTPESLKSLLGGLSETWIGATEGEGKWSPYDVIGHLIHSERVNWMRRARHVLAGEKRAFDPLDREAQFAEGRRASMAERLETFAELRRENVASLRALHLTESDLDRRGLHPDFGEVALGQLLAAWVVHDLDHLTQIARTMAKVYADAVGPWSAYLSVLRDREPA
jgi:hypothetical protein